MPASKNTVFPKPLVEKIEELTTHYPRREAALIPALHLVQERFGYISDASIEQLSEVLGVSRVEILGTLTFYTMFRREPSGRFHINVCKNLSCTLVGSRDMAAYLSEKLNIRTGQTTEDGLFTLGLVECLGACSEAPVMEIDGEYFFRLTPDKVDEILEDFRRRADEAPSEGGTE